MPDLREFLTTAVMVIIVLAIVNRVPAIKSITL